MEWSQELIVYVGIAVASVALIPVGNSLRSGPHRLLGTALVGIGLAAEVVVLVLLLTSLS